MMILNAFDTQKYLLICMCTFWYLTWYWVINEFCKPCYFDLQNAVAQKDFWWSCWQADKYCLNLHSILVISSIWKNDWRKSSWSVSLIVIFLNPKLLNRRQVGGVNTQNLLNLFRSVVLQLKHFCIQKTQLFCYGKISVYVPLGSMIEIT